MTTPSLKDKVALVTGASRGIGAAIAQKLAGLGASVAINFMSSEAPARIVADAIHHVGGKAEIFRCDVTESASVKSLVRAVAESFGHIDILVNNAGAAEARVFGAIDPDHFVRLFHANVLSMVLVTQEAVKYLPGFLWPCGQHIFEPVVCADGGVVDLCRGQSRGVISYARFRQGTGQKRHHGERGRPGSDRDRHDQGFAGGPAAVCAGPYSFRPYGPSRGGRRRSGIPCLRRRRMDQRANDCSRWRPDLRTPSFLNNSRQH